MAIKKWFHSLVKVCLRNLSGFVHPCELSVSILPPHLSRNPSFGHFGDQGVPNILCVFGQCTAREEEMIKQPNVWNPAKCTDYHLFNSFLSWTERGLMARTYCSLFLDLNEEYPADFLRWLRVTCWIDLFVPSFRTLLARLEQWKVWCC